MSASSSSSSDRRDASHPRDASARGGSPPPPPGRPSSTSRWRATRRAALFHRDRIGDAGSRWTTGPSYPCRDAAVDATSYKGSERGPALYLDRGVEEELRPQAPASPRTEHDRSGH